MARDIRLGILIGATVAGGFNTAVSTVRDRVQGIGRAWSDTDAIIARKNAAANRLRELRNQMIGLAGAAYAVGRMMRAHGDVLQAQGEIASLGIDTEGIEAITRVGKEFSSTWAGTTVPEFVRASYDVKSGISSLGDAAVGEFTRIAALTAVATKSSTAEMTNLFAKGYGIYRDQFEAFGAQAVSGWRSLSDEERDIEFGKYFSAGISASVQAFRTDGAQMSQALSSLGASATTAGVAFSEQLAVLGALQRTMSGSEAATKFQSFLANASKAGESLGLDFIDEQTGMLMSVPEILDRINDAYGGVIDQAAKDDLRKAFGDKAALELVDVLMAQRNDLRAGAEDIEKSLSGGLDTTEAMARAMQQGRGFELLGQQIGNLGVAIGKIFYPAAEKVAVVIGAVAVWSESLAERFPVIGMAIGVAAVAIGTFVAVVAAAAAATWLWNSALAAPVIGGLIRRIVGLNAATLASTVSTKAATVATWALAAAQKAWAIGSAIVTGAITAVTTGFRVMAVAVMANPLGLAIAGIAMGAILVIKYWEPIKGFFGGLWGSITSGLSPVFKALRVAFEWSPLGLVVASWEPIKGFFTGLWDWLKSIFSGGVGFLAKVWEASPLGLMFKAGQKLASLGKTALGKIFGGGDDDGGGQLAMAGGGALPASALEMPEPSGGTSTVNAPITINTHPGMDAKAVADEVDRKLRERERVAAARSRGALHD